MTLFDLKICILNTKKDWDNAYNYHFNFEKINKIKQRELIKSVNYLDNLLNKCIH